MDRMIDRRTFAKTGAAATLAFTALSASRALGANERIRLGFIGVANRGGQLLDAFLTHKDIEVVALCDVARTTLERANEKWAGGKAALFGDFRKLIDRNDLDAIVIATPDHWHALQAVAACDAGKDVYVEKPLSVTIHEGRRMVEAARRNRRVVQVGTHRRSSPLYHRLVAMVRDGKLGKVTVSRAYRLANMYPAGIGRLEPSAPPADLDWDLWLGPRPARPYQANIAPYRFRWWQLYSSQMGNWGVHYLDAIRWITGELAPRSICAMGGKFAVDDDRTIPDTLEATFQFASGRLAIFGQYEATSNPILKMGELELRGTHGTLYADEASFEIVPEKASRAFPTALAEFKPTGPLTEPLAGKDQGGNENLTAMHARNFLDCMRSRAEPNADIEIGHRSTTFSHLANISLAVGQRLEWDAEKERFTNSDEANGMLHYEYRKPWKLD